MKVKFVPQNVEFEIKPGESVMHVAQDHGIYIKSVCKGVPSCAECRVRIVEGEHNVLPPASEELSLIGTGHFIDRRRLSCQLKCFGDITVDMNEQIAKETGLIVGRKKKMAIKDDRVEQAVRRSESTGDSEDLSETNEAGEPLSAPTEGAASEPRRDSRGGGGGNRDRDRGPRGGSDRAPRENRGGGREARGPRENRGGQREARAGQPSGENTPNQQPSRPGGPAPAQNRPQQPRPPRQGPRPEGEAQAQGQGPGGEPREGGGKRRRRRRGKGGGGGGQGPVGDPQSRPGAPKPQNPGNS